MGLAALIAALLLWVPAPPRCRVPVFRYALEHWPPDPHVLIATGGHPPLVLAPGQHANLRVRNEQPGGARQVELRYPGGEITWYEGAAEGDFLARLVDSPRRRAMIHELLSGTSAVWLLVAGRDARANERAHAMLLRELDAFSRSAELPDASFYESDPRGSARPSEPLSAVPLRISFSLQLLERGEAREEFLLRQITAMDPSFAAGEKPLALAIFGRGRAIPVPASKLTPRAVQEICSFLCGPCSCRVKALNPGVDLLLCADWEGALRSYPEPTATILPDGHEIQSGRGGVSHPPERHPAQPEESPEGSLTLAVSIALAIAMLALVVRLLRARPARAR